MSGAKPGGVWQALCACLSRACGSARGQRPQTPPVLRRSLRAPFNKGARAVTPNIKFYNKLKLAIFNMLDTFKRQCYTNLNK